MPIKGIESYVVNEDADRTGPRQHIMVISILVTFYGLGVAFLLYVLFNLVRDSHQVHTNSK